MMYSTFIIILGISFRELLEANVMASIALECKRQLLDEMSPELVVKAFYNASSMPKNNSGKILRKLIRSSLNPSLHPPAEFNVGSSTFER